MHPSMIFLIKLILASNSTLQNIYPDTKLNHIKHKRNILTEKTYERFKIRYKKFYSQEEIENIHKHVLKLEKTKEIENLRIRNDYIKVDLETWLSKHRMKILEVMLEVSDLYFGHIQKILFCLVDNLHGKSMSNYRTFMNKEDESISLVNFFMTEYFRKDNELKINEKNQNFDEILKSLESKYTKVSNINYNIYCKGLNTDIIKSDTKNITVSDILFFFNIKIIISEDFKELLSVCSKFYIIKRYLVTFREKLLVMKSIHFLLTVSVISFRIIKKVLFKDRMFLYEIRFLPVYKIIVLQNLKTKLLLLLKQFYCEGHNGIIDKKAEEIVKNSLERIFKRVNSEESLVNV